MGDAGCRHIELELNLGEGYFDRLDSHQNRAVYSATPTLLTERQDADIAAVVKLMNGTDRAGRKMALAAVKVALAGHKPITANAAK